MCIPRIHFWQFLISHRQRRKDKVKILHGLTQTAIDQDSVTKFAALIDSLPELLACQQPIIEELEHEILKLKGEISLCYWV